MTITDSISGFLADLRNSAIGQRILAERDAAIRARRAELVARRTAILRDEERDARERAKSLATLAARREAAQIKAREANDAWCDAQGADISASYMAQQRVGAVDAELTATADGRIQAAIDRVHELFNRRRDFASTVELTRDMVGVKHARGNRRAIDRFVSTHLTAIDRLRSLALVDMAPADVDDAIAAAISDFEEANTSLDELDPAVAA